MKDYGMSGGETIEMSARLLGGMNKKSLSPKTDGYGKRQKEERIRTMYRSRRQPRRRKCQTHLDIDPSDNARWMEDTLKKRKERTDDVSELEINMSRVQWNMTEVDKKTGYGLQLARTNE